MSPASRYGYASRISFSVIPSATIATTVATGTRRPRMHGTPPILFASTVIRVNFMLVSITQRPPPAGRAGRIEAATLAVTEAATPDVPTSEGYPPAAVAGVVSAPTRSAACLQRSKSFCRFLPDGVYP